jgi:arylsulfatase A-like enzyme
MKEALDWVDAHHDETFFLFLPLTIPHANNEAGNEGMEVPDLGAYADKDWPEPQKGTAAMITRMDAGVGALMAKLEEHGLAENTIVIFTSDNGPHREGGNDPDFFDSNGPLKGIKRSMHDGGIRVPMIVRWPDQVPAGTTVDGPWGFVDVLPTMAEVIGVAAPPDQDGLSVLPLWTNGSQPELANRWQYWEFHERGYHQAARRGRWKAVRPTGKGAPLELYDLENDLGEETDVAGEHPEIVAAFIAYLESARVPSEHWRTPAEKAASTSG